MRKTKERLSVTLALLFFSPNPHAPPPKDHASFPASPFPGISFCNMPWLNHTQRYYKSLALCTQNPIIPATKHKEMDIQGKKRRGKGIFHILIKWEHKGSIYIYQIGYVRVALGHARQADISFKYRLQAIKQQKALFLKHKHKMGVHLLFSSRKLLSKAGNKCIFWICQL